MKKTILFVLTLFLFSCSRNSEQIKLKYDTENIAILDVSKSYELKSNSSLHLKNEDIVEINRILKLSISDYNAIQIKKIPEYQKIYVDRIVGPENVTIDLTQYKRQYIPLRKVS